MKESLTIYYDDNCSFCKNACLRIKKYLFLKNTDIKPMSSDEGANKIFLSQYSWVVYEYSTRKYFSKSSAWWRLVYHSPFFLLSYIVYAPLVLWIGDKIYDYIARNRSKTCKV